MGAMVQTVTGNLVEVSTDVRIEIFNGVNEGVLGGNIGSL